MAEKEFEPLGPTILVHVELPQAKNQEDLEELHRLAESAGSNICDAIVHIRADSRLVVKCAIL